MAMLIKRLIYELLYLVTLHDMHWMCVCVCLCVCFTSRKMSRQKHFF